jgi:hypothetical protein
VPTICAAIVGLTAFAVTFAVTFAVMGSPASASNLAAGSLARQIRQDSPVIEAYVARRGAVVRRRPGRYRWAPGGAIAAGAAIGFVTAAAAAAWAGAPPEPGDCWYYTDASQTQGFWDACPSQ